MRDPISKMTIEVKYDHFRLKNVKSRPHNS
jgi:hypothetical protein